jgi:BirA family biotin operon repressor/biotin-[acetyl-CoA-carboxylase] ligase
MASQDLSPSSITEGLATRFVGQRVIYYPRLPSTMDAARLEAQKGAAEGTVVIAGEQSQGRGRMRRTWLSPSGNIALSIVLYPDIAGLPYLVMIASLAAAHGIEAATGLETRIKWPNDVLIGGKKVCGVLIENEVKRNKVAYAVIGIGINVDLKASAVSEVATTATSIKDELGRNVLRANIIRSLLTEFERLYRLLPAGEAIFMAWRDRLDTLKKRVVVRTGSDVLEGIAESVDESGGLILRGLDGSHTRVVAGDVTLRHK